MKDEFIGYRVGGVITDDLQPSGQKEYRISLSLIQIHNGKPVVTNDDYSNWSSVFDNMNRSNYYTSVLGKLCYQSNIDKLPSEIDKINADVERANKLYCELYTNEYSDTLTEIQAKAAQIEFNPNPLEGTDIPDEPEKPKPSISNKIVRMIKGGQ